MHPHLSLSLFAFVIVFSGASIAHAQSVRIDGLSPGRVVAASSTLTFAVSPSGFISPTYSVSDSFTGTKSTRGTIDKSGYFSWTPTLYDAGQHTLTVLAKDAYSRAASTTVNILVTSNAVILTDLVPANGSVAIGSPLTFTLLAPGFISPLTYAVYDGAQFTSVSSRHFDSTGKFRWIPGSDDLGIHELVMSARDQYGHDARVIQKVTVTARVASSTAATATTTVPAARPAASPTLPVPQLFPGGSPASGASATATAAVSAARYRFVSNLAIGSRGTAVTELQKRLIAARYLGAGSATGYYGALTAAAVRKFQAANKIQTTGTVGPQTRAALNK